MNNNFEFLPNTDSFEKEVHYIDPNDSDVDTILFPVSHVTIGENGETVPVYGNEEPLSQADSAFGAIN